MSLYLSTARLRRLVAIAHVKPSLAEARLTLSVSGDTLRVAGLDLQVEDSAPCKQREPPNSDFCLSVLRGDLAHVLSRCIGDEIALSESGDGKQLRLSCGRLRLRLRGAEGAGAAGEAFKPVSQRTVPANWLRAALPVLLPAVSKDSTRRNIRGMLLDLCRDEGLAVTTDGKRLHVWREKLPKGDPLTAVLPTKVLPALRLLLFGKAPDLLIEVEEKTESIARTGEHFQRLRLSCDHLSVVVDSTADGFANWGQMEMVSQQHRATFARNELLAAVRQLTGVCRPSDSKDDWLTLRMGAGHCLINAYGPYGEAEYVVDADVADTAGVVSVQGRYFYEALRLLPVGPVKLSWHESVGKMPLKLGDENRFALIAPLSGDHP